MSNQKSFQANRHKSIQVLLLLFSAIFVVVIGYGYYHLLAGFGWFLAIVGGGIIAALAWYLAKVAGTGEGGMKANWVLIVPLFIISAAGVYNSMMVYLEGAQVLSDTASEAQVQFGKLEAAANTQLTATGVSAKANRVASLRDALFSEIENPLNCGQGPEARRLIGELKRELPEFKPLSSPSKDCAQNETIIADYKERIDNLIARAPWNNADLSNVATKASKAREELADLRSEISKSYSPSNIRQIASVFEGHQTNYQDLIFQLGKQIDTDRLEPDLSIVAAQSLGNVYKLPALFLSRLDEASTYVYLLMALCFDLFLVYLFEIATKNRVRKSAIAGPIAGAW